MIPQRTGRRRARDELLAPWIAGAIILAGWGLAARLIVPEPVNGPANVPVVSPTAPSVDTTGAHASSTPRPAEPVGTSGLITDPLEPRRGQGPADQEDAAPPPPPAIALDPNTSGDVELLRSRELAVPVSGVPRAELVASFEDARSGGRVHEALDILAPRGTPVLAVEAGTVAKLFTSVRGGITLYQFDPSGTYCYYYGHLERYAPGLTEGARIERGAVIGYVGTTGNAPADTPHLHFAIFRLGPERQWWEGVPIDPYVVLR